MNWHRWGLGLIIAGYAAFCSGCGGGSGGPSGAGKEVVVDGSSTVFPISMAAQEAYAQESPGSRVIVDNHGTGGGFSRYIEGEVDIVDASREAKPEEEADAEAKGFGWTRFLVGHDGITVVVHPENDFVDKLTVEQLKALFEPGSTVSTWKELDPSWPDRKINLYTPDDDSGTYEFFSEAIVGGKSHRNEGIQVSSDDNVLVSGVAQDKDGLAYFGFAYYAENQDKVKAVPIQNGTDAEPVAPSPETIYSKDYAPLSRPLFIYVKNASLQRPEVSGFVKFYLGQVGTLSEAVGYVSPTEEELASNLAAYGEATGQASPKAE